jgi:hypothetical protein
MRAALLISSERHSDANRIFRSYLSVTQCQVCRVCKLQVQGVLPPSLNLVS